MLTEMQRLDREIGIKKDQIAVLKEKRDNENTPFMRGHYGDIAAGITVGLRVLENWRETRIGEARLLVFLEDDRAARAGDGAGAVRTDHAGCVGSGEEGVG